MVLKEAKMNMFRPLMVASIATLIAIVAFTTASTGWASANSHDGTGGTAPTPVPTVEPSPEPTPDVPPGQLTRRGVIGKVLRVGDSSFVIDTRHGKVLVLVNEETVIKQPPNGEVRLSALEVGDRVGVLLVRPENDTAASSDGTDVIRTATAKKVLIIPSKVTRRHHRAVILEKIKDAVHDRLKYLDEDGDEVEIETDVEIEGDEGEEVLLITRSDENGERLRIAAATAAERIEERLLRLAEKRGELEALLQEVRKRYNEQRAKLLDVVNEKIRDGDVDEEVRARIEEARTRAQARADEAREIVRARVDEARTKAQARVDEARAKAQDRIDEAKGKIQDRVDEARDKVRDRVDEATERLDQLTPEQRDEAEKRIEKARDEADERIREARDEADERIRKAREESEDRITKARDEAEDRIEKARDEAEERISDARDKAEERIEDARKRLDDRREDRRDDDSDGDGLSSDD